MVDVMQKLLLSCRFFVHVLPWFEMKFYESVNIGPIIVIFVFV